MLPFLFRMASVRISLRLGEMCRRKSVFCSSFSPVALKISSPVVSAPPFSTGATTRPSTRGKWFSKKSRKRSLTAAVRSVLPERLSGHVVLGEPLSCCLGHPLVGVLALDVQRRDALWKPKRPSARKWLQTVTGTVEALLVSEEATELDFALWILIPSPTLTAGGPSPAFPFPSPAFPSPPRPLFLWCTCWICIYQSGTF